MTASEARKTVNDRVEVERDIIMSLIDGSLSLEQNIAGLHPRTLNAIEQEGFDIVKSHKVLVPGEVEKDLIYISWY